MSAFGAREAHYSNYYSSAMPLQLSTLVASCTSSNELGFEKDFIAYFNNERHRESLGDLTTADVYFGRLHAVLTERAKIRRLTMKKRKKEYLAAKAA